jgi:hypothetical protein
LRYLLLSDRSLKKILRLGSRNCMKMDQSHQNY